MQVNRFSQAAAALGAAALITGCGGGTTNNGAVPSTTQGSLSNIKLQVAVGTAFNAADGSTGINIVSTFRQPNGLSGTLANTPSITGPSGFTVPAGFPGAYATNADAGGATINSSPQVNLNATPTNTTLGTFTGAFSYGLAPLNSDEQGASGYFPGNPNAAPGNGFVGSTYDPTGGEAFWPLPFGAASANQGIFLIGPPAVPFFNDGTFPGGFAGYSPGFTAFEITPKPGAYTMNVAVTPSNATAQTFTASSNSLGNVTPLPAPVVSGVTENGGGLVGTVTVGPDPRVTETLVFINDQTSGLFFTVEVTGAGAKSFTLPPFLGPCNGAGCQNSSTAQAPSLATGDSYVITAISFDYPALENGPPMSTSQTPTITGSAGQTDLAIGPAFGGTY